MGKKSKHSLSHDNGLAPYWIELTPDGRTLVFIYPWCVEDGFTMVQIATRFYEIMGEPTLMSNVYEPGKFHPPPYQDKSTFAMVFPHQDLTPELKDIGERMTSAVMLKRLGMTPSSLWETKPDKERDEK